MAEKALSYSASLRTATGRILSPSGGPAASTAFKPGLCEGVAGSKMTATCESVVIASLNSSQAFDVGLGHHQR